MIRSNETVMGSGQTSNGDSRGRVFGTLDYVSVDGDDGNPGNKPNQGLLRFDNLFGNVAGQIASTDTIVSAKLTRHRCQCIASRDLPKGNGNPVAVMDTGGNGDVPLPPWALAALGVALFGAIRKRSHVDQEPRQAPDSPEQIK